MSLSLGARLPLPLLLALLLPPTAQAAPAAVPLPDPADAAARVPTLGHESALARYRRLDEGQPAAWAEANQRVTRIGGWRSYAREPLPADPQGKPRPSAPVAAPTKPEHVH